MAPVTVSQPTEPPARFRLRWSRGLSLTGRILAVNILAVVLMMSGLFFLDSYRALLITERMDMTRNDAILLADILPRVKPEQRTHFLIQYATVKQSRVRLYARNGEKIADTFTMSEPGYTLAAAPEPAVRKRLARSLDNAIDFIVLADRPPLHREPAKDTAGNWPELQLGQRDASSVRLRNAADATPVISAAARSPGASYRVLLTSNPRDVRTFVRAERADMFMFFLFVVIVSVLLSLFLARTIVHPLRHLAHAATKVKLGRAREVNVPRLPERRDEIGLLARAVSDMSNALRHRIDATEAFAADVTHEIKNPLASLRSALDALDRVEDAGLRRKLMDVAHDDVQRMDRLISDISEASRVDSQLTRAKFERIDLGAMIEQVIEARKRRGDGEARGVRIAFARPRREVAVVMGEDLRLERVLNNLIDNAISFSPPGGLVQIVATVIDNDVLIRVHDEGPGVPPADREAIFRRFHSARPRDEEFGTHSGLGLAIARTIVEGHQGEINVGDREDGKAGACFEIRLPKADPTGS